MNINDNVLYRYDDVAYSLGVDQYDDVIPGCTIKLTLHEYPIIRRTNKGAWIDYLYREKFVLLTARKQFACETKEAASQSFHKRKTAQIRILSAQLDRAKKALSLIEGDKGFIL